MHSFIPSGELTFRGLLGRTNITLNKITQYWEIVSHTPVEQIGQVLGVYNGSKTFPLGVGYWTITEDCMIKKTTRGGELKLSKVIEIIVVVTICTLSCVLVIQKYSLDFSSEPNFFTFYSKEIKTKGLRLDLLVSVSSDFRYWS
jgi:hypothetical protein